MRVCWELEWHYFPQIRHLLPLLLLLLLPERDLRKLRFEIGLTSRQFMILDPVSGWSLFRNSSPPWRRRRRRSYGSKSPIWFGKCNRSRQQVIEHLFSLSSFAPLFFFFFVVVVVFIIFMTFGSLSSSSSSSAFWLLLQVFLGWLSAKFRAFCRELRSPLSDGFFLASANRLPYCCPLLSPHPWLLNFSDTTKTTSVPADNKSSALPQCCYSFFPSKLSPSSSSFLSFHWKLSFSIAI